jgi:hypothetical protein
VSRLAVLAMLVMLALTTGACAGAAKEAAKPDAGARASAFDSWAHGNGTGAFFKALGPAGGTGVR